MNIWHLLDTGEIMGPEIGGNDCKHLHMNINMYNPKDNRRHNKVKNLKIRSAHLVFQPYINPFAVRPTGGIHGFQN